MAPDAIVATTDDKMESAASADGMQNNFLRFWETVVKPEPPATKIATAADYAAYGGLAVTLAAIDNYFRVTDRGSTFYIEFVGGWTTFFAMCYIIVLNGVILSTGFNGAGGLTATDKMMSTNGSIFATCLSSGWFTFMMGIFTNLPIALAPGMGLNGVFKNFVSGSTNGKLVGGFNPGACVGLPPCRRACLSPFCLSLTTLSLHPSPPHPQIGE